MRFFRNKRLILVLAGLVWIHLSLLPLFSVWGIKPDFFFIFLAFYAFRVNWKPVVGLAFFIGLIRDLLTNSFFGLETASMVGGTILLQFFAMRFDREKRWIQAASLFSFSWFALLLFSLAAFLIQRPYFLNEWTPVKTFLISVYTTAVGFVLFPFLEKWFGAALRQKQYELF